MKLFFEMTFWQLNWRKSSPIYFVLFSVFFFEMSFAATVNSLRTKVVAEAQRIFATKEVSYVYGGHKLGDDKQCVKCNQCLEAKSPKPNQRLKKCPVCAKCSLDCSHFTQLVYEKAGLSMPYLPTDAMLNLSKRKLLKLYHLVDLGSDIKKAKAGDLLVYRGHVVLLEKLFSNGRGDIIHATGGRDIRLPGQGIQRKRQALVTQFHGPLLRILRHRDLMKLIKMRSIHD
jgi:cell wall-associated NlpC family hydrolase